MSTWPRVPLRSLVIWPPERAEPTRDPESVFRYVDISSIDPKTKVISAPQELIGRDAPSRARRRIRSGDVLVATTRPNLNGVSLVPLYLDGAICSTGITPLRSNGRLHPSYLSLVVRSPGFVSNLSELVQGALYPAVSDAQVLDQLVVVPPLADQERLADWLTRQIAAVDEARRAADRSVAEGTRLRLQVVERAIGKAAEWPMRRLGEVAEIQLGKMLSPASRLGRRPMPYLRNANVQWDRFELSELHQMDFDEREEAKFLLRRGDVLVCEGGEPGRAAVWDGQIEPCLYQKALHRLRPIDEAVDPQYLVYRLWLSAMRGDFTNDHAQTTIAHLPAIRLAELQIATPPIAIQRQIVATLREQLISMNSITAALEAELEAIDALPEALLRKGLQRSRRLTRCFIPARSSPRPG